MTYVIQKEVGWTYCEDQHPVRLPRLVEQPPPWDSSPRAWAIRDGKKGYICPGGEEHTWVVFDGDDDRKPNVGIFDTYREAVAARDEANAS